MTVLRAHAKVNLWLRVLGRDARSGYHYIETAFCRLELADELVVEPADRFELTVEGADLGDPSTNLVSQAAEAFSRATGREVAQRVRLTKSIPAGAGLGGGSSDAATFLRNVNEVHDAPLDERSLYRIAQGLGADVPFFLTGAPLAIAWGRGERMKVISAPPPAWVIVVWPGTPVSTRDAYQALGRASMPRPAPPSVPAAPLAWEHIARRAANDFEQVIERWIPDFAAMRTALLDAGARFAMLAGSGSAVFGEFDERPDAAVVSSMQARFPDSLIVETRTV